MLKYSKSVNHYTSWNLTKLDILDTFPVIKVAVAYKDPKTGQQLDYFPSDLNALDELEVVWKEFEGWMTPTTAVKTFVRANPPTPPFFFFLFPFSFWSTKKKELLTYF